MSAHHDVSRGEAADRISAYVYGNILMLAALVVLSDDEIGSGAAVVIVLGTGVSTFVAHTFAERLGAVVRGTDRATWIAELRSSVPIVSAATVPAVLMVVGSQGWLDTTWCLRLAEAWIVVRLFILGLVVGRLQGHSVTLRTWIASAALAASALVVVALKVVLTH